MNYQGAVLCTTPAVFISGRDYREPAFKSYWFNVSHPLPWIFVKECMEGGASIQMFLKTFVYVHPLMGKTWQAEFFKTFRLVFCPLFKILK